MNSLDIINNIADNKKSDALDMINDLMQRAAAEAITNYKQVVASTYFNEPVEPLEVEQ
jgi:hypothetical protein